MKFNAKTFLRRAICIGAWIAFAASGTRADEPHLLDETASLAPSPHLVGWLNALIPGSGQVLLGNPWLGAWQATYETSTFLWGYSLSSHQTLSLDGAIEALPRYSRGRSRGSADVADELYGDLLQEFGIKAHMVNTFEAYRESWRRNGDVLGTGDASWIDPSSSWDLFTAPFDSKTMSDVYVWAPIAILTGGVLADYFIERNVGLDRTQRVTPYSNFLYGFNYGVWQPFGSGAPEEMFYRGFLQEEVRETTDSSLIAIAASTTAFAFSHAPDGRPTAAFAGAYLGFLDWKFHGRLSRGIAVHFWGDLALGLETILLNHEAQRTTPPGSIYVQVNY